jgi:hypothetical protein
MRIRLGQLVPTYATRNRVHYLTVTQLYTLIHGSKRRCGGGRRYAVSNMLELVLYCLAFAC